VASGNDKGQSGELDVVLLFDPVCVDVAFHVVCTNEGDVCE